MKSESGIETQELTKEAPAAAEVIAAPKEGLRTAFEELWPDKVRISITAIWGAALSIILALGVAVPLIADNVMNSSRSQFSSAMAEHLFVLCVAFVALVILEYAKRSKYAEGSRGLIVFGSLMTWTTVLIILFTGLVAIGLDPGSSSTLIDFGATSGPRG